MEGREGPGWQETQKLKERLDQARSEVEVAQRRGDLARASELLYGVIPDIERQLAHARPTASW